MVDPIGAKPKISAQRPVSAVAQSKRGDRVKENAEQDAASIASTARSFAEAPPVDAERVARIRQAVKEGSFPITPATIADRLIALKLQWRPHD
ncbi:flagellar biosynthesis anti-sigma factor FlgM [Stakelama saccharophila]|uniref:Negative regulator of flagellin synthesis n=1 Tax=Stakelama saccharophila TaxID=3075605 RepID=A0ABZ0B8T6_9SPHN|nr:flagellar biosynthesis anti-sigma factor FlgM [Stakelama sp. W311]WNO53682.1 flagellar biosynthesis anti-sigma factor FlgM [Stakelama sp. W311]